MNISCSSQTASVHGGTSSSIGRTQSAVAQAGIVELPRQDRVSSRADSCPSRFGGCTKAKVVTTANQGTHSRSGSIYSDVNIWTNQWMEVQQVEQLLKMPMKDNKESNSVRREDYDIRDFMC